MSDGSVQIKFTGTSAEAERAITSLEKKYESLEGKIKSLKRNSSTSGIQAQMQKWSASLTQTLAGYVSITGAISKIISLNEQLLKQADEYANKQDRLSRAFAIQAGMNAIQGKAAQASINAEAVRAGIGVEKAAGAATQLVSSDFTPAQAQGPALRELLGAMAAAGDKEGDPEKFALSVSQLIAAANLSKSSKSIRRVGQDIYALKKGGNLNAEDMEFIAPKIQGFINQGGTLEEGLATFTAMKDTTNREQAATASKIMWERLMGANGRKVGDHLKKIGLKATDVDFIGETQTEVATRIRDAIAKLPKEKQQPAIQGIFGNDAGSAVTGYLSRIDRVQELLKAQSNSQGYDDAIGTVRQGRDFVAKQQAVRRELQITGKADDVTSVLDELEMANREAGVSEFRIQARRFMANTSRYLGMSGEQSASFMLNYGESGQKAFAEAASTVARGKGEDLAGFSNDTLEKIRELMQTQTDLMQQEQKNKPAKRPVAAKPDEP